MNQTMVIQQLNAGPAAIAAAETALLEAETLRQRAQAALADAEAALILDPEQINGKNAEQRQATAAERAALEGTERQVARCKVDLLHHHNEFAAGRALARLLAAGSD